MTQKEGLGDWSGQWREGFKVSFKRKVQLLQDPLLMFQQEGLSLTLIISYWRVYSLKGGSSPFEEAATAGVQLLKARMAMGRGAGAQVTANSGSGKEDQAWSEAWKTQDTNLWC